eukprot:12918727-Prorocentrum_lima.AAC.1
MPIRRTLCDHSSWPAHSDPIGELESSAVWLCMGRVVATDLDGSSRVPIRARRGTQGARRLQKRLGHRWPHEVD